MMQLPVEMAVISSQMVPLVWTVNVHRMKTLQLAAISNILRNAITTKASTQYTAQTPSEPLDSTRGTSTSDGASGDGASGDGASGDGAGGDGAGGDGAGGAGASGDGASGDGASGDGAGGD